MGTIIKKVRVTANAPADGVTASDVSYLINKEFEVWEQTIVNIETGAKEVEIDPDGTNGATTITLYPGEYEIIEEEQEVCPVCVNGPDTPDGCSHCGKTSNWVEGRNEPPGE